jgi:hypothetical protein
MEDQILRVARDNWCSALSNLGNALFDVANHIHMIWLPSFKVASGTVKK